MHEVALQAVVGQIVGQAGQNHALVVGIVGFHRYMVFLIVTLIQPELVIHLQFLESLQVLIHGMVVDADGHQ